MGLGSDIYLEIQLKKTEISCLPAEVGRFNYMF